MWVIKNQTFRCVFHRAILLCTLAIVSVAAHAQSKLAILPNNVTASSSDANLPTNTIDGNLGNRWSADATSNPQWIQYNLGGCYYVSSVRLAWHNGHQRKYKFRIQVFNRTRGYWQEVPQYRDQTSSGTTSAFESTWLGVDADAIRVQSTGSDVNKWVSLSEVEIYVQRTSLSCNPTPWPSYLPPPPPATNATFLHSASSSDDNVPVFAVDGDLNTRWSADAKNSPQWIQFSIPACKPLDSVSLAWYRGLERSYNYKIQVAYDAAATVWYTVISGTSSRRNGFEYIPLNGISYYRAIRIESTGSDANKWVSLNDAQIFTGSRHSNSAPCSY